MIASIPIISDIVRLAESHPRNWQDDPTFDLGNFLGAYPDQLAIIQPLLNPADPTSPVLDDDLERLIDAHSEGEARSVISQIANSQRRWNAAAPAIEAFRQAARSCLEALHLTFYAAFSLALVVLVLIALSPPKQPAHAHRRRRPTTLRRDRDNPRPRDPPRGMESDPGQA
jgi:hypothetical protein